MAILDAYGRPAIARSKFVNSAVRNDGSRPFMPVRIADIDELIPATDWQTLLSTSRKLYANMGIPRGAITQKADYSVGDAWNPVFLGENKAWGREAEKLLLEQWYPNIDVRGPQFDFKSLLHLDSIAYDRDGDAGLLAVAREDGFPQIQRIGAHRIGSRSNEKTVRTGPGLNRSRYLGMKICNGVILDDKDRPAAYQVLGDSEAEDEYVSASRLFHCFDPTWYEQCRGLPVFIHALNDLRDMLQSQQWEQITQLALSAISLVEYNDDGGPDENDFRQHFSAPEAGSKETAFTTTEMMGGLIRYFKSNSGGKIEQVEHNRPGDLWDRFQDRLVRATLAGMPWSYALVWKPGELNAVVQRSEILKVKRSVAQRQNLIEKSARWQVSFAVASFINLGMLPPDPEWNRWTFTRPAELSIDAGRDIRNDVTQYQVGSMNIGQLVAKNRGISLEEHYEERAREIVLRKQVAQRVSEETQEEISDDEMRSIPGAPAPTQETPPPPPSPTTSNSNGT